MAEYNEDSIYYGKVYREPTFKTGVYTVVHDPDHPMPYHVYGAFYKEGATNVMLACFQYEEDLYIMLGSGSMTM